MEFNRLIHLPESQRDERWEEDFLTQFALEKVQLESDQASLGPDAWPYLLVRTGPGGSEPVTRILTWLADRGMGLAVNSHKMIPDYVFPYGMIWTFKATGRLSIPRGHLSTDPDRQSVIYGEDKKLIMGPPSETYLPLFVRSVLREFLTSRGFNSPRILVVATADYDEIDLVFSTNSLSNLEGTPQRELAERLAWFLPADYRLVFAPEQGFPEFYPL